MLKFYRFMAVSATVKSQWKNDKKQPMIKIC